MVDVYCNDNYSVDHTGVVINKKRGTVVSNYTGSDGYTHLVLHRNNKKQRLRLHDVVFWSHTEKISGLVIDHIDANKTNNVLSNLRAVTNSENVKKAYDCEYRLSRGSAMVEVTDINTGVRVTFKSIRSCCAELGLNRHNLSRILKGDKVNTYKNYKFSLK